MELSRLGTASQLQEKVRQATLDSLQAERRLLTRMLAYVAPQDPAGVLPEGGVAAGELSGEERDAVGKMIDSFLASGTEGEKQAQES